VFESGRPLTYIRSSEEHRVGRLLREVAHGPLSSKPLPLLSWSLTQGMRAEPRGGAHDDRQSVEHGTETARAALEFIAEYKGAAIFHLKDFHEPMRESAEIRRRLRDLHEQFAGRQKYIVISSPVRFIPEELERDMMFVELRPPDPVELKQFLREEIPEAASAKGTAKDGALREQLSVALQGLTLDEVRYALRRALAANKHLGPEALAAVREEKRLLINRSGVLEFIAEGKEIGEIGGLEGLKTWLTERKKLFQMRDSLTSEIVPKGVLLMGIPGCGKSLSVKAIAATFDLPLYRVDMIEIFSGRHGKPEGVFVEACKMMEDMAPAVLWFDEIEMGITSTESSGEQGRIFAFFLTWMQEKARGLFVAATANRVDLLPAEMIRKGRFDEVFFVDIPIEEEQLEIFKIHLHRRGVDPGKFDLTQVTKFTNGWTGAEIEQCVISAVTKARLEDRDVTEQDMVIIAARQVPLSRTMKEQINHIRNWAFERAVRASPRAQGR
jgi:hypothetical protein